MGASKKHDVHIAPNHKRNGLLNWSVKREGTQRTSGTYENKVDAMAEVLDLPKSGGNAA